MFRRERHRKVQALLAAFDASLLTRCSVLFGGGTRIVLELDEYRDSHSIDVPLLRRGRLYGVQIRGRRPSATMLFSSRIGKRELHLPREIKSISTGSGSPSRWTASMIRVEMIREARIELDPGVRPAGLAGGLPVARRLLRRETDGEF